MSKKAMTILIIIAVIVVLAVAGYAIHHALNPEMPMDESAAVTTNAPADNAPADDSPMNNNMDTSPKS